MKNNNIFKEEQMEYLKQLKTPEKMNSIDY
jgi:hypothetical protein